MTPWIRRHSFGLRGHRRNLFHGANGVDRLQHLPGCDVTGLHGESLAEAGLGLLDPPGANQQLSPDLCKRSSWIRSQARLTYPTSVAFTLMLAEYSSSACG
jgi:hypothetical protein